MRRRQAGDPADRPNVPTAHDGRVHPAHPLTGVDDTLGAHVEGILTDYLAQRQAEMTEPAPTFATAIDSLATFVLSGGKRLRPTFAWWAWRGAGGEPDGARADAVLRAVSALELLQACALVHDDLMDASAVRRGSPTVHVAFAGTHRTANWLGESDRFGMAAAILLGDLALAWADDMVAGSGLPAAMLSAAQQPWRAMRSEMLAGQYLDVLAQANGDESPASALRIARMKTAAYTVERPLHLGAALAGAGEHTVRALRGFGADIGVAFQLRDDLLGVFGDTELTGKPAGDDLREGKRTLLVALGLQRAEQAGRHADAEFVRGAIGRADLDAATIGRVREVLVGVGAVAAVEQRIADLTSSAMDALAAAGMAEPAMSRLTDLAIAATKRNR
jgi:geranylgeranyl diphosphate synthase type I